MSISSHAWADYESGPAHKLLSDNRDRYIAQSAATRGGVVAPAPRVNSRVISGEPSTTNAGDAPQRNSEV